MTTIKSLPKSLHTVTVLVQVARLALVSCGDLEIAMDMALETLGYSREADPYGLIEKAEAQLLALRAQVRSYERRTG